MTGILATNANYAKRTRIDITTKDVTLFDVKKQLIKKAFLQSAIPTITNLVYIDEKSYLNKPKEKKHTILVKDYVSKGQGRVYDKEVKVYIKEDFPGNIDYFEKKHELKNAYDFFTKNNITAFFFIAVKKELEVAILDRTQEIKKNIPLKLDNNNWLDLQNQISMACHCSPESIRFFSQKTKKAVDMQKNLDEYYDEKLIAFTFPVEIEFNYLGKTFSMCFIDNLALTDYKQNIEEGLKAHFENLLFKFKGDNSNNYISTNEKIHDYLKKFENEKIKVDVEKLIEDQIGVLVSFDKKEVKFSFKYDQTQKISDLINQIYNYFTIANDHNMKMNAINISDNSTREAKKTDHIIKYKDRIFQLHFYSDQNIVFERTFALNQKKSSIFGNTNEKEYKMCINPAKKISHQVKEIANKIDIDPALLELELNGQKLELKSMFSDYIIPKNEKIEVNIKEHNYAKIKIYEQSRTIKFYFVQNMKIGSIKKAKEFVQLCDELQKDIFFVYEIDDSKLILDETKTFAHYKIGSTNKIVGYTDDYHIFKFERQILPIREKLTLEKINEKLINHFKLQPESFIITYNAQIYKGEPSLSKCKCTEMFEVLHSITLELHINYRNGKTIKIENTKKAADVINILSNSFKTNPKGIILLNDVGKRIMPETHLYDAFSDIKRKSFDIQAKDGIEYPFMRPSGKFFNEFFLPTTKISEVISILKTKSKKMDDFDYLIYKGRLLDAKDTLEALLENEDPIELVKEKPEQINITLTILAKDDNVTSYFQMIKGTEAENIRHFAAQLVKIDDEKKITLELNGEELNDEEEINEDSEIIAKIQVDKSKSEEMLQNAADNFTKTVSYTLKTTQVLKPPDHDSDYSDESFLAEYEYDVEDIFERGNGTYEASKDNPDTEFIFKFKEPNKDLFKLQLPKDSTVKDVKEKIAERNDAAVDDITLFIGNQRLSDFNVLTELAIPESVHYFTVKIIDLSVSIICTRIK